MQKAKSILPDTMTMLTGYEQFHQSWELFQTHTNKNQKLKSAWQTKQAANSLCLNRVTRKKNHQQWLLRNK